MSNEAVQVTISPCRRRFNNMIDRLRRSTCCRHCTKDDSVSALARGQDGDGARTEEFAQDVQSPREKVQEKVQTEVAATQVHFVDAGETILAVKEIDAKCCVLENQVRAQAQKHQLEISSLRVDTDKRTLNHRQMTDQQCKRIDNLHSDAKRISSRLENIENSTGGEVTGEEWVRCSVKDGNTIANDSAE